MRGLWILFLFSSCAVQRGPVASDTELNPNNLNWAKIYAHELKVARENNDIDAILFFWPEYLKELEKTEK